VPHKPPVYHLLPSAIDQTLDSHHQASQLYWYINAEVRAIARFVSFDQCTVDLAFIKQAHSGPHSTKHENCLIFCCQLKETRACCAANIKREEAYKKSLAAHFEVSFADCLAPAISTSATSIAPKPVLIDFKKIQGKDHVKIF
jgi:hypothetical protein